MVNKTVLFNNSREIVQEDCCSLLLNLPLIFRLDTVYSRTGAMPAVATVNQRVRKKTRRTIHGKQISIK